MSMRRALTPLLVVPVSAALFAVSGCANGQGEAAGEKGSTAPAAGQGNATCSYPKAQEPVKPVDPPATQHVPDTGSSTVTLTLDGEPVVLTLDRAGAPCTVNSFESLAKQGWFTNTRCHRLTQDNIFVLQCGDPSGTGTGGPGYVFADELTTAKALTRNGMTSGQGKPVVVYPKGTLAMANTGQPGTNGSQFFMVYEDSPLPPDYTVFGKLDANGLTQVQKIAAEGVAADNTAPNAPARITAVSMG